MMKTESPMPAPTLSGATPMEVLSAPAPVIKVEPTPPPQKKEAPLPAPTKVGSRTHECPMFLRKTYHMVDTCDPAIASWSEDGETFVVKNADVFEKKIIPQFFKHSKFSSFVRQLNFYGFRKIKYHDTIRIDPKLEAETANFWRFHHEKFRRGRPDWLIEIKRQRGKESATTSNGSAAAKGGAAAPAVAAAKTEDVSGVKSEVTVLKERIAVMSKNIDDLTNLVQKMAVSPPAASRSAVGGPKRTKVKQEPLEEIAMPPVSVGEPDVVSSSLNFSPGAMFPSTPPSRQQSLTSTSVSDDEFLDDLVHVLEDGNMDDLARDSVIVGPDSVPSALDDLVHVLEDGNMDDLARDSVIVGPDSVPSAPVSPTPQKDIVSRGQNRPDPKLMDELGDALSVLPKDVQEMMIKRLISTITSKDSVKGHVDAASALSKAAVVECDQGKSANKSSAVPQVPQSRITKQVPDAGLPVAAAALGALLSQYGMANAEKANICMPKSISPAIMVHQKIPVHA
eukprot:CAMPEP_0197464964 /NCGR_PEP_ID=MMETSP1175-20131217/64296_1 /TAXON_ID=1003142 /ORGANISM="Triceratium dubium, Strain CCMP147" /LENGTH=508 /DNA_ID=CAMNT_0043000967 /DNA_START=99 /DNA_END=1625 /DNA_ORIENTATION=-